MSAEVYHSKISPSKFNAWMQCACFEAKPVGEAAERGSTQHTVLEHMLKNRNLQAKTAGQGLNDQEWTGVQWAHAYILEWSAGAKIDSETRLFFYDHPDDFEDAFSGTADAICEVGSDLHLFDYKSGEDHGYRPQMVGYAAMLFQKYPHAHSVIGHVLFGRYKNAQKFEFNRAETFRELTEILEKRDDPDKKPTPCTYCGWCSLAATCEALVKKSVEVAKNYRPETKIDSWHPSDVQDVATLSRMLKTARIVSEWAESVEFHCKTHVVKTGEIIPGFGLQKRAGNRAIEDAKKAMELSNLAIVDFLPCCSVKVGELEKKLGKPKFKELLEPVVTKKGDSYTLVAEKEEK